MEAIFAIYARNPATTLKPAAKQLLKKDMVHQSFVLNVKVSFFSFHFFVAADF